MSLAHYTIIHLYTVPYIQTYQIYCKSQSSPRNQGSFDQGQERKKERAFRTISFSLAGGLRLESVTLWIMFSPEILYEIMYYIVQLYSPYNLQFIFKFVLGTESCIVIFDVIILSHIPVYIPIPSGLFTTSPDVEQSQQGNLFVWWFQMY